MAGGGENPGNFTSSNPNVPAVTAAYSGPAGGYAVLAEGENSNGLTATTFSSTQIGLVGANNSRDAAPDGPAGSGVFGLTYAPGGTGVFGANNSTSGRGVQGNGPDTGVGGYSDAGIAVLGQSNTGDGVRGTSVNGIAVHAYGPRAGVFVGDVEVTGTGRFDGDVKVAGDVILNGADCAEEFDIAEAVDIEPGTVMVLDQDGALHQSQQPYDKRVAGVISGAGDYRPGVILDRQQTRDNRLPVALVGKVYCKVDAQYAPIEVGDLLTTSSTPGHAMKAGDPFKAFGSVIGKALRSLEAGQGMIPILIALQ